jgi:hypothetical protein
MLNIRLDIYSLYKFKRKKKLNNFNRNSPGKCSNQLKNMQWLDQVLVV